jgi:SM-20-related protein
MTVVKPEVLAQIGLFVIPDFLDADLCASIRAVARLSDSTLGTVVNQGITQVDEKSRKVRQAIFDDSTVSMVESKLNALISPLEAHFNVKLTSYEPPQFLIYGIGDYHKPHSDNASNPSGSSNLRIRKISTIIFLNSQSATVRKETYCGGSFAFYRLLAKPIWENCRTLLNGEQGLLIAFPSDVFHEVLPVTHGERFTIVSWFI